VGGDRQEKKTMNIAFKRLSGAGIAALIAGSAALTTPASAQYCRYHNCGDAHRHDGYRHEGYHHRGPGVVPLVGGIVGGIIGGAAAAASGGCWRHDEYGRAYRVC
jgi:hypothetical protein